MESSQKIKLPEVFPQPGEIYYLADTKTFHSRKPWSHYTRAKSKVVFILKPDPKAWPFRPLVYITQGGKKISTASKDWFYSNYNLADPHEIVAMSKAGKLEKFKKYLCQ